MKFPRTMQEAFGPYTDNKIEECHCLTPADCPSPNICFEDCLVLVCLVAMFIAIGVFAWL